jgi:hypothetical protein
MLVHDRRAYVGDVRVLGEPIDDECVEAVVARHRHVDQEVLISRRHEDAERVRLGFDPVAERLDVAARRWPDPDRDERLHRPADRGEVDVQAGAPDDATVAQRPRAIECGRRRHPDRGGDVAVRAPCIHLQFPQDRRIKFVEMRHQPIVAELNTYLLWSGRVDAYRHMT